MYGGLFGDLPSAKKQKATSSSTDDTSKNDEGKNGTATSDGVKAKTLAAPPASATKGNWFAPPRQAAKASKTGKSQFLQTVGKSGTTMAFVPTAALKLNRKKPTDPGNTSTGNGAEKVNKNTDKEATDRQSSFAAVTTTTTTTRVAVSKADQSKPTIVVDIHGNGQNNDDGTGASGSAVVPPMELPVHAADDDEAEKITDPYDPYVPNDLLEYWETLAAKKHREKLERDTREALERQKAMRKQLEDERMALAATQPRSGAGRGRGVSNLPAWMDRGPGSSGGDALGANPDAAAPGRARGRGRGVSNLPAWLVEQQRREAANNQ